MMVHHNTPIYIRNIKIGDVFLPKFYCVLHHNSKVKGPGILGYDFYRACSREAGTVNSDTVLYDYDPERHHKFFVEICKGIEPSEIYITQARSTEDIIKAYCVRFGLVTKELRNEKLNDLMHRTGCKTPDELAKFIEETFNI